MSISSLGTNRIWSFKSLHGCNDGLTFSHECILTAHKTSTQTIHLTRKEKYNSGYSAKKTKKYIIYIDHPNQAQTTV